MISLTEMHALVSANFTSLSSQPAHEHAAFAGVLRTLAIPPQTSAPHHPHSRVTLIDRRRCAAQPRERERERERTPLFQYRRPPIHPVSIAALQVRRIPAAVST